VLALLATPPQSLPLQHHPTRFPPLKRRSPPSTPYFLGKDGSEDRQPERSKKREMPNRNSQCCGFF
jgi:hypothetical protein